MQKQLYLFNSLTQKKQKFEPIVLNHVGMYTCGITVYHPTHIGHIKKYVGDDLIRRSLEFLGYKVKHVQNVTDVGHLVSDGDEGEDKMEKGARILGTNVWDLAKKLTLDFYKTMDLMNVLRPVVIQPASSDESIFKQIEMIEVLLKKEYAYIAEKAVYFDVSKLSSYNPFSPQSLNEKISGSREDVIVDTDKKNPADFALWVFTKGIHKNHIMRWQSPWGLGFPGWHIECSAISISNLGENFDIHTGGIDHKEIHHPNEIAQNFAYCGHDTVKFWIHHNFLKVDNKKMSKSLNNFYSLEDVVKKGYSALDFRYFILQAHYRSEINFTWEALQSAKNSRENLILKIAGFIPKHLGQGEKSNKLGIQEQQFKNYINSFYLALCDDINIPQALSVLWGVVRDNNLERGEKIKLISKFDSVFGLKLIESANELKEKGSEVPENIIQLANKRIEARKYKNFKEADRLRTEIQSYGYEMEDTKDGYKILKI